jgi:hypothetical protein
MILSRERAVIKRQTKKQIEKEKSGWLKKIFDR